METVFLSSNNSLPGGRQVRIPGSYFETDVSFVSTVGVSRSRILISDGDSLSPFHCPDGSKATKVFILWGKVTQMGVCTDQDWLNPIWGKQHPSFPGLWIVVTRGLHQGDAQFKIVTTRRSTNDLLWEPKEFMNKTVKLGEGPQLICSQWGSDSAEAFDVPQYTPSDVHGSSEDDSEGKDSKILGEKTDNIIVENADAVSDGKGLEPATRVGEDKENSEKIGAARTDEADSDAAVQVVTYNDGSTIFILRGKVTRMGVCTDQEWSKPIWGTQHPSSPGLWTVTTSGLQGVVEFKIITTRRCSNQLLWEPEAFVNKVVKLEEGPQVIYSEWGSDSAEVFDVPEYEPEPIDVFENVENGPEPEGKDLVPAEILKEKTGIFGARTNKAVMDAAGSTVTDVPEYEPEPIDVFENVEDVSEDRDLVAIEILDEKTDTFGARTNKAVMDAASSTVTDYTSVGKKADYTSVENKADCTSVENKADYPSVENKADYTSVENKADNTSVGNKADCTSVENKADELFIKQTIPGHNDDMQIKQDNQILTKKRRGFFKGILRRFRRKIHF